MLKKNLYGAVAAVALLAGVISLAATSGPSCERLAAKNAEANRDWATSQIDGADLRAYFTAKTAWAKKCPGTFSFPPSSVVE